MRRTAFKMLLALTICLSVSCAKPGKEFIDPDIKVPPRPAFRDVVWQHEKDQDGKVVRSCLNEAGSKNLQINISRMWAHIGILEGNACRWTKGD